MGGCVSKLRGNKGKRGPQPTPHVPGSLVAPTAPPMPTCEVYAPTPLPNTDAGFSRCLDGTGQQPIPQPVRPTAPERNASGLPPAGVISATGAAEFTAVPCDDSHKLLCLTHLTAPAAGDKGDDARPPVTVSAVIDRSGSMSGEKLQLVQRTLHFVIRELRPEDRLGIIAYDDTVTEPLPLTHMTPEGKEIANVAVDRIVPGGCTNLSGGLFAGLDQVAGRPLQLNAYGDGGFSFGSQLRNSSRSRIGSGRGRISMNMSNSCMSSAPCLQQQQQQQPVFAAPEVIPPPPEKKPAEVPPPNTVQTTQGGVSSVWLFTDGLANAGVQHTEGIIAGMKERRPTDGPSVFTFGFGAQHNDSMLRNIAEYGHGMYYFIQDAASIPRAFAECLGGLLSVVAQNITVTLNAQNGVRILRILGHDDTTLADTGRQASVIVGDMYAEEQRDIVAELSVAPEAGCLLTSISLTYAEAPGGRSRSASCDVTVERPERAPKEPLKPLPVLDRQRNRLLITQALRSARDEASGGRFEAACKLLQDAAETVKLSPTGGEDYCRELLDDLKECEEGSRSRSEWASRGEKMNCNIEMGHRKQRSCGISAKAGRSKHMYSNTRQTAMISEWCD